MIEKVFNLFAYTFITKTITSFFKMNAQGARLERNILPSPAPFQIFMF